MTDTAPIGQNGFPPKAIAVRQPWAWAIIHAGKDVEHRPWNRHKSLWYTRGRVAIFASMNMTIAEYEGAKEFMLNLGIQVPPARDLIRGGIIGSVAIVSTIWQKESRWYMSRGGAFILANPQPCTPIPVYGQLDFFIWKVSERPIGEPSPWMKIQCPRDDD
jgi:hypothetical protein